MSFATPYAAVRFARAPHRSLVAVLVGVVLAALLAPQATLAADSSDAAAARQQLADKAGCGSAKVAAKAPGIARWLEDCGSVNPEAAPETAARRAIAPRAAQLGLRLDGRDLTFLKADKTNRMTYVRFQQTHNDVPVFAGQVVVQYDRAGRVQLINNHTLPNLAVNTTPAVAAAEALIAATAETIGADRLRLPFERELVIYNADGAPALAWHVVLYTQQPVSDWHVMVSAASGMILATWDAIAHDDGSGQTYDPNAVQTTGDTTLTDGSDADTPTLQNARVNLTLTNLDSGIQTLKGSYVDATGTGVTGCNLPYTPGTATSATRVYDYTRDDDRFEEVVGYAAVNGVQTWFQSLGLTNVNNRSVPIDVHCTADDNSFYSSGDKALHMGDGGVDDGEDADIVVHEYGHSVHDNQVPGWGPLINTEQRAMGEGFGDFLAGLYYVQQGDATHMSSYRYCIGEWNAVSYNPVTGPTNGSGCLRWINGRDESDGTDIGSYPGVPTQEHSDGRFWSATLTCAYEGMGGDAQARDDIMKILLASHFSLTPDMTTNAFEDAVDALLQADETYLDAAHWTQIGDCAFDRGLIAARPPLPECGTPPFSDVAVDHPFCKEIKWMRDNSISTGFNDGTYRPTVAVTRQAMSAFMSRLAGATPPPCSAPPFPDVPVDHPFCKEIKWMVDNNITTGFEDGTYRPSEAVTRQAMSAFLSRLAEATLLPCILPPFSDVSTDHPFCEEIKWMADNNITTGFDDGTYRPLADVTRQAMSAFMQRVSALLP